VMFIVSANLFIPLFSNSELYSSCEEQWVVIINLEGYNLDLICVVLWTHLRVSFNGYVRSSV
jgi:hypothetical protein